MGRESRERMNWPCRVKSLLIGFVVWLGLPLCAVPNSHGQAPDIQAYYTSQIRGAEAGDPTDQYRLALRYLNGEGVEPNEELARKWMRAAATNRNQEFPLSPVLRSEVRRALMVLEDKPTLALPDPDGKFPQAVRVVKIEADGILYRTADGAITNKLKFLDLPESVRAKFGYDPAEAARHELDAWLSSTRSNRSATGALAYSAPSDPRYVAVVVQPQGPGPSARENPRQAGARRGVENISGPLDRPTWKNIEILSQIVSDYRKTHTYMGNDVFACGDMACDVWNMVQTKGLKATIMIGNLEKDTPSMFEANHAWVLAEAAPGRSLALETTGGYVVKDNRRYYQGISFSNPKEFKEFLNLLNQHQTASLKLRNAQESYNQTVSEFNGAHASLQRGLIPELQSRASLVNERTADRDEIAGKIKTLLLTNQ